MNELNRILNSEEFFQNTITEKKTNIQMEQFYSNHQHPLKNNVRFNQNTNCMFITELTKYYLQYVKDTIIEREVGSHSYRIQPPIQML